jgi:Holliday junction DNA helicase RuvA
MLSYLSGIIKERQNGEMILAVGSESNGWVGYQVRTPEHPRYDSFITGEKAEVYLYSHIREDAFDLYGFLNAAEKNLFTTLLSVSGVGPKLGLGLLSHADASGIIEMIVNEDKAALTNISGVGKKTAERMVLELKDVILKKQEQGLFGKITSGKTQSTSSKTASIPNKLFMEAYLALQGLGFKELQAKQMVEAALRKSELLNRSDAKVEDIIKHALQAN